MVNSIHGKPIPYMQRLLNSNCNTNEIEIEFELTLLNYKVFSCKDVRSKFLGVRLLAVQSNTQSGS